MLAIESEYRICARICDSDKNLCGNCSENPFYYKYILNNNIIKPQLEIKDFDLSTINEIIINPSNKSELFKLGIEEFLLSLDLNLKISSSSFSVR